MERADHADHRRRFIAALRKGNGAVSANEKHVVQRMTNQAYRGRAANKKERG